MRRTFDVKTLQKNVMLNLTLLGIAVLKGTHSTPLRFSQRYSSVTIADSAFARLWSPAIATSVFTTLIARNSAFSHFLEHPIHISNSDSYFNATIESKRTVMLLGSSIVSNCIFKLCMCHGANGGAIFTLSDLTVRQCWFIYNTSPHGGHIYSCGKLSVESSTFEDGYSPNSAGFANEGGDGKDLTVLLTTFTGLESQHHSCFERLGTGLASIDSVNISGERADESNAGLKVSDSHVIIKRCLFFEMCARFNTGIVISNAASCVIENSLFWLIRAESDSATCVFAENTKFPVAIEHCTFIDCGNKRVGIKAVNSRIVLVEPCGDPEDDPGFLGDGEGVSVEKRLPVPIRCRQMYKWAVAGHVGYATRDAHQELMTKRLDVVRGIVIGAFGIAWLVVGVLFSMLAVWQSRWRRQSSLE